MYCIMRDVFPTAVSPTKTILTDLLVSVVMIGNVVEFGCRRYVGSPNPFLSSVQQDKNVPIFL